MFTGAAVLGARLSGAAGFGEDIPEAINQEAERKFEEFRSYLAEIRGKYTAVSQEGPKFLLFNFRLGDVNT